MLQALPPRPPEGVGDDHRDLDAELVARGVAQCARRGVGVDRQQRDQALAADVRGVDAGVGADEAVVRLGDEHARTLADDAGRLPEHSLDLPQPPFLKDF